MNLYSSSNLDSRLVGWIFIDRVALAKQGDNALVSVRPSIVCVGNQWAYADNCMDVVDRLLMIQVVEHVPCGC